ncbi:MAG: flavin reductase family protein [Bacteriovoracaceae bacterium]|jgi:flavin reductase (DIM6/NTAB) family NADH-FMN oxidoreductase RutF|nr:flavin reductase family protein [Bacteriovoracaceae bacterium]
MLSFNTDGDFKDNYKFLIGSILPRPIAVVSTLNENGTNNVAPFSFFTAISASPMIIAFSPLIRTATGKIKDTPRNIIRQGEFVINFVSEDIANQVNECSCELAYGEDEFKTSGLTPLASDIIKPNRIKESLIHFECKFRDRLNYGDNVGAGQLITGEVVKVHVSEDIYEQGRIITEKFQPIGRGAGNDWIRCTDLIQLERKMKAQMQK